MLRVLTLSVVIAEYAQDSEYLNGAIAFIVVYSYEATYVFINYCIARRNAHEEMERKEWNGKIWIALIQSLLLVETGIMAHIPIAGFDLRHHRVEGYIRHALGLGSVLFVRYHLSEEDNTGNDQVIIVCILIVVHYFVALLLELHLRSYFSTDQEEEEDDAVLSVTARKKTLPTLAAIKSHTIKRRGSNTRSKRIDRTIITAKDTAGLRLEPVRERIGRQKKRKE